jgi:hypothetical protein
MTTQTGRGRATGRLEPGCGGTRRADMTNGAPCKGGRKGLGPGATQGAPRRARQTGVVAVLTIGTRYAAEAAHRVWPCPSIRRHQCDRRELHSDDVYVRSHTRRRWFRMEGYSPTPRISVGVCRGAGERDARVRRRRKCQSARQQPPQIGARAEGRLAWPQAPSPSGHLCKAPRSSYPRVALPRIPALAAPSVETAYRVLPCPGWSTFRRGLRGRRWRRC